MQKLRLGMLGCGNIKHQHMAGIYEQAPFGHGGSPCSCSLVGHGGGGGATYAPAISRV
ncbi:MAG: hypothetical protein HN742_22845 [Lentisphaerae bacterium]|nr:hypothetical protein [Lentisphaerota bacterium]MBT4823430.1 hypothetical protein [Lentisphaerota bacterium]MBT5606198.1 hypothetical protein [Lentisphaerota bacterium]MBT7060412.1 hypothetical protein [Lentisphaerota bacterium]MBT7844734.1 hypothetical protein [Lentisphaerota bacterium]